MGNRESISAEAVGELRPQFGNKFLLLYNNYFIPNISRNLISVFELYKQSFSITFNYNEIIILRNGVQICCAKLENGLYILHVFGPESNHTEMFRVAKAKSNKRQKLSNDNETYLWYLRLDYISLDRINRLTNDGPLKDLNIKSLPVCESCLKGKMTKRPFTTKGLRAEEPLELIHSDVCRPFATQARGGYEYYVTFIDDYSRYGYVYLMRWKSETFEKYKEFHAEAEKQLGKSLKVLRSDRGGEYLDFKFTDYLIKNRIVFQLTAPGTPL